ncbi:NADH dehydrogenase [ubiquinone] 1 beta subcomplex subunit 11, mitochondrial [Sitodiplosis mosellana]|uniref:NADH dehydrogenase [ubiquinone] 1 beta subcomplex subunit 11, mitochondrial n=1 Tax=Sitodiplosis mosellana TaxID=263140 RepID=UPI0024440E12|nr:NADH dehydrogenase [ubiquinone] 1 beta subcomplex subunit 11, mitochondrial [Sitodiplosis mosellana]
MASSLMRCGRLVRNWQNPIRMVSTSPKKNETSIAKPLSAQVSDEVTDFSIEAVRKSKNWVSYGFSRTDKDEDRQYTNGVYFMGISVAIIGTIFWWSYLPDRQFLEWSQREAYIVLREREAAGLEPISGEYVDPPSQVVLPSDEELGDAEIII